MKNIIVFGTGKYFEQKEEKIRERFHIISFLDNKVCKSVKEFYRNTGIPIINPADLDLSGTAPIFLMSVHFIDMWKQLVEIGVAPARLVFPYCEKPFFENDEVINDYILKMEFDKECIRCILKDETIKKIKDEMEWREFLRAAYKKKYALIPVIADMGTEPISRQFGTERGAPIDRYYIEQFLKNHQEFIREDVLEIEDSTYTYKFSGEHLKKAIVMDVSSKEANITFNANLETGEGVQENIADCFILTQTLMYVFDLKTTAKSIGRLLKKGGVALITCSGISQNSRRCMDNYGCYFNFNKAVFEKMFEEEGDLQVLEVGSYGNVKTVSAHINGLCCEDLKEADFIPNDKYYPLIVYAVVKKNEE